MHNLNLFRLSYLVVNKTTELPGEGFWSFVKDSRDLKRLSRKQKKHLIALQHSKIYMFPKWHEVLQKFCLEPAMPAYEQILSEASRFRAGGESESHRKLKEFIAEHPGIVGLPQGSNSGQIEFPLPSGDSLDVLFVHKTDWVAVEVKPSTSPVSDITRGIFQCVKYRAVIEAYQLTQGLPQNARGVLVLESEFPKNLLPLKHMLSVEVIDNIEPK